MVSEKLPSFLVEEFLNFYNGETLLRKLSPMQNRDAKEKYLSKLWTTCFCLCGTAWPRPKPQTQTLLVTQHNLSHAPLSTTSQNGWGTWFFLVWKTAWLSEVCIKVFALRYFLLIFWHVLTKHYLTILIDSFRGSHHWSYYVSASLFLW